MGTIPAEDDGLEAAWAASQAPSCAMRTFKPNLVLRVADLSLLRPAEIGMQMPWCHAESDVGVELLLRRALGQGVPGATVRIPAGSFS